MDTDRLLDLSEDELVRETQTIDSPDTFSKDLIQRLGICHTVQGTETACINEQSEFCQCSKTPLQWIVLILSFIIR